MNWYKRAFKKIAYPAFVKNAYPYSMELCPHCSSPLNIDLLWEKGYESLKELSVGRCTVCHKAFAIKEVEKEEEEEQPGFKYVILEPLSYQKYYKMLNYGSPEINVSKDEESFATTITK